MVTIEHPDLTLPRGICQPGCLKMQHYLMKLYNLGDSGCYNPDSVLTSGEPSFHVPGQAIDLTANYNDSVERVNGDKVFDWFYAHREELNLQQIIFGHRIWSSFNQTISLYNHSDHFNHCHASIGREAAVNWKPPTFEDLMASGLTQEEHDWLHNVQDFCAQSKNPDTNQPYVKEIWKNFFQGIGISILTGEFRKNWKDLKVKLGMPVT